MRTYRTSLVLGASVGGEHELETEFRYTVVPGSADYWDGQMWQQGWAAEVNLQSAKIKVGSDWVDMPEWMFGLFYADNDFLDELLVDDAEADEYACDHAADTRREERRLER